MFIRLKKIVLILARIAMLQQLIHTKLEELLQIKIFALLGKPLVPLLPKAILAQEIL
jgi:hypothetical protein